ncbi:RNA polymerase sigma factor [Cellulomonas sp. P22]|uniref:RNA polymerase sigma factor n=1 Tax=Cellulomonas sp. P22 TaxID=3373189 RepID=UPI003799FA66
MFRAGSLERGDDPERGIDPRLERDELLTPAAAFEAFVVEHHPALRRFTARIVGSSAADDVVSDTFVSAWSSWQTAPAAPDARRAWVFGIARHRSVDHIRAAARRRNLVRRLTSRPFSTTDSGPDTGILTQAGVDAIVSTLGAAERDALLLTVIGGLTCAEAAAVLGCSETAITSRLTRARQRLRETLPVLDGGSPE